MTMGSSCTTTPPKTTLRNSRLQTFETVVPEVPEKMVGRQQARKQGAESTGEPKFNHKFHPKIIASK